MTCLQNGKMTFADTMKASRMRLKQSSYTGASGLMLFTEILFKI